MNNTIDKLAAALRAVVTRHDAGPYVWPEVDRARIALAEYDALSALQECTGAEPDADDADMVRTAPRSALTAWADDLETRCGFNVQTFRDALSPLETAAFRRVSDTAYAIVSTLLTNADCAAGWCADYADPRGETDGGADLYNTGETGARNYGLYLAPIDESGGWYVYDGATDSATDCTAAGGALDADKARNALRALIARGPQ